MTPDVLPYLFGAGSTLAVTLIVQLWVVPHVESRKRFADRWEKDVRQLGETLAFELPKAEQQLVTAIRFEVVVSALNSDIDPQRLHQARQKQEERVAAATGDFTRARLKINWLVRRIVGASKRREMGALTSADVRITTAEVSTWVLNEDRQLPHTEADTIVSAIRKGRETLADAVEAIADRPPPHDVRRRRRIGPRPKKR